MKTIRTTLLSAAAISLFALSGQASAWTTTAYGFAIDNDTNLTDIATTDTSYIHFDTFSNGNVTSPSGPGSTVPYDSSSLTSGLTETVGAPGLHMNANAGTYGISAFNGVPYVANVLRAQTWTPGVAGSQLLTKNNAFAVGGLFDLTTPDPKGRYGIRLGDYGSSGNTDSSMIDRIEISVSTNHSGQTGILFRQQDWLNSVWINGSSSPFSAPAGAVALGLDLTHAAGSSAIGAGWVFLDSLGNALSQGDFGGATIDIFHGEGFTKADLFTVQVVPEPQTWLLMGAGLVALLVGARRKRS